ncbi:hypothetical protein Tco_0174244 [Tanacetum coccineum]
MAEIKTNTTMEEFVTKDRANYSGITSITVNGKAAYELKGKFLDDLPDNAFSETNREDAIEHIEYFLKIVDHIDLPNVNYERLRLVIFPISLDGNASKWFDEFKGSITTWVDLTEKFFGKYYSPSHTCNVMGTEAKKDPTNTMFEEWLASKFDNHMTMDPFTKEVLRDFLKKDNNKEGITNKGFSDLEEANKSDEHEIAKIAEIFRKETNLFDYETPLCTEFKEFNHLLKVDTKLFTHDIERTKTYEDYESELNNEVGEPWSKDGVPYELYDHICEPFRMVRVGYMTYFQDYEWYNNLMDSSLKEEALKQKAIYEKSWGDATQSVINFCAWLKRSFGDFHKLDYELLVKVEECWWKINNHECSLFADWRDHIRGPYANIDTTHDPYLNGRNGRACNTNDNQEKEEQHKEGRCDLFNDPAQEPPVCKIRRFEMIKYSFGQEEEYVAIKEYEYDDLTRTNEDACHAYQEIFHNMDEGWLVTRAE